jgi:putative DNA primase/helicase
MQPGDPMPDTRPYTLAAAYLWQRKYANVTWAADASGLEQVQRVQVVKLRHWREEFFAYTGTVYQRLVVEELSADLTNFLNSLTHFSGPRNNLAHLRVTRSVQGDVVAQLRCMCQVLTDHMPAWIGGREPGDDLPDPKHIVAFQNGLLDVDAWLADPGVSLMATTPLWFSEAVLPCQFDPAARCCRWLGFLDQALDGDIELMCLLQEWFGYCLTGDTSAQKMLWLHGVSGAGKSTVVHILRRVVGERNTVSFDLWSLLGQFTLSSFMGKRLATSADAHLGNGNEADKVLAKLKGISGEDEQLVDRKNREMLSSVRLTVRFVISTNEFPNLPDASDALARRALFIPFERSFQGEANPRLTAELDAELAGITVWALAGLRRLLAAGGRFSASAAANRTAAEFRRLQSPVHAFAEDWLAQVPNAKAAFGVPGRGSVDCDTAYRAYCRWSKDNGKTPVSRPKFGERLRRAVPSVTRNHPRDDAGNPYWEYRGVEFSALGIAEFLNQEMAKSNEYSATG